MTTLDCSNARIPGDRRRVRPDIISCPMIILTQSVRYNPNEDPLKLIHDECWTVDAIEYESDDVILHDRPGIGNLTAFEVSAVGA